MVKCAGEVACEPDWEWGITDVVGENVTELFSPAIQEGG